MNPLLRLLGVAASNGLLTGQIIFSTAFVAARELPNWIQAPRQVNACQHHGSNMPGLHRRPNITPVKLLYLNPKPT
jgi:hypothetical protein